MKEHINDAIEIIKQQDIDGCITGSCLLDYFEGQDIDVFVYNESSFNKLLFFMHYHPMFTMLDPMEIHKFNDYIDNGKSSLEQLGLITLKFKYNLLVDVNIVYKKFNKSIFDVITNFDIDIICLGYDIKTKQSISLRETTGMTGTWNKWNKAFYKSEFWSTKRLLRQFERIVKYTARGYELDAITDKYISLVEEIVNTENYYRTERGTKYFTDTIEQFQLVLKLLYLWKAEKKLTPEQLLTLKTLI